MPTKYQTRLKRSIPARIGVTLVEVIFAIGVILIGLLGLMSVLPLAGNRAQSAIGLNTATAVADNAFNLLVSGGFLESDRLVDVNGNDIEIDQSLCIDPMRVFLGSAPEAVGGFNSRFFPYYQSPHNPLNDPSAGPPAGNIPFPRMERVGLKLENGRVLNREEALKIVESQDDVPTARPADRTLNATVKVVQATENGMAYGKRLATGEYSWFATLSPKTSKPGERFGILSIVVVRNRDRTFSFPASQVLAAEFNANAERVGVVTGWNGFRGGSGGTVTITSSSSVKSSMPQNTWVMLSRGVGSAAIHRWYRVVGTDGSPEFGLASDFDLGAYVAGGEPLWRRSVLLDGSDWSFGPAPPPNLAAATHATIVDGVVSVTERIVRLHNH
jgi:type II secretory pathway pseudopilin PulG